MQFTKEMVADLFLGQEVIDRKKKELKQFLPMIEGLLDWERISPRLESIRLPCAAVGRWTWALESPWYGHLAIAGKCRFGKYHSSDELPELGGFEAMRKEECHCNYAVSLHELLALHAALPTALNALLGGAPGLEEKLQVFLEQAKEA